MKLRTLKIQAVQSASRRGHVLKHFEPSFQHGQGMAATAYCAHCKAYVQVMETPAANQIDIGGDALAVHCPVKSTNGKNKS